MFTESYSEYTRPLVMWHDYCEIWRSSELIESIFSWPIVNIMTSLKKVKHAVSFLAECVLAFAQSLVIGVKPLSLCTLFDTNAHDGPNLSSPVYVV